MVVGIQQTSVVKAGRRRRYSCRRPSTKPFLLLLVARNNNQSLLFQYGQDTPIIPNSLRRDDDAESTRLSPSDLA
jgi:hypothetical protein